MDSFKEDLLPEFILESREHLDTIEPGLLEIEEHRGENTREAVNEVFRAIHSLKGSASYFGFKKISQLAHVMENLLMMARDGELALHQEQIDLLISGTDKLRLMVEDIESSDRVDTSPEVDGLGRFLEEKPPEPAPATHETATADEAAANDESVDPADGRLQELAARGHLFYVIKYALSRHVYQQGKVPHEVEKLLGSIGTVLDCDADLDQLPTAGDPKADATVIRFTVATVLQPDYLTEGLELESQQIRQLALNELLRERRARESQVAEVVSESEEHGRSTNDNERRPTTNTPEVENTIRVPVPVLNKLMDLAGELVLNRNQLKLLSERLTEQNTGYGALIQRLDLVTTDLQTAIMNVRLQPVRTLFNRFPRVIRDLSRQLGKEVELKTEGNEVDLDKSILEALSDPLTHLVRNCVDHGIESPDERVALGKPRLGTVGLRAYQRNEQIHIDVSDNGRGVDPECIARRVIERGLLPAAEVKAMPPHELVRLVFLPGFSTVDDITEVSGRGVGMDVVKTNIEKLGGSVDLMSTPGKGSTITLKLPLTLAIIPAQIVEVGNVSYAIPQVNLEEMVHVGGESSKYRVEDINGREILRLRGELLPLVDLRTLLHRVGEKTLSQAVVPTDAEAVVAGRSAVSAAGKKRSVLVLSAGENRFGLIVEELLDREEVVVKPLSRYVKACRFYAGATILGDGRVAMILDVAGLAEASRLDFASAHTETVRANSREDERATTTTASFLIFEGGRGQQFGLPLPLVARIDKIPVSELVELDGKTFFRHQNSLTQVIWLHKFITANPPPVRLETVSIIVPRLVPHPIGIGAISIHDIVETGTELNTADHSVRGVLGSALLGRRPVLFLDLLEILEQAAPELYPQYDKSDGGKIDSRMLLVDGNPINRALLKNYFRSVGVVPDTAATGMEAFQKIQSGGYDTVFLPPKLPVMTTTALLSQMRTLQGRADIRLIGLSNNGDAYAVQDDADTFEQCLSRFDKAGILNLFGISGRSGGRGAA